MPTKTKVATKKNWNFSFLNYHINKESTNKLPYIDTMRSQIRKEINALLNRTNLKCKFILINSTFKISNIFKFKDKQETLEKSTGVRNSMQLLYEIRCSTSIGQTKRNVFTRRSKHDPQTPSHRTDVTKHLHYHPNHAIDFNNPCILSRADHGRKLLLKEKTLVI